MSRFDQIEPEQATGRPKELFDKLGVRFGTLRNCSRVLADVEIESAA